MMAGGYTLQLSCDCRLCRESANAGFRVTATYHSDLPDAKRECLHKAEKAGWHITIDGICYAPGHARDMTLEKTWRGGELEID